MDAAYRGCFFITAPLRDVVPSVKAGIGCHDNKRIGCKNVPRIT